jgi:hypothetical protein
VQTWGATRRSRRTEVRTRSAEPGWISGFLVVEIQRAVPWNTRTTRSCLPEFGFAGSKTRRVSGAQDDRRAAAQWPQRAECQGFPYL